MWSVNQQAEWTAELIIMLQELGQAWFALGEAVRDKMRRPHVSYRQPD